VPSETTGVPPSVMAFGHLPRGPLAVLKETWSGEIDLPLDLGKKKSLHVSCKICKTNLL